MLSNDNKHYWQRCSICFNWQRPTHKWACKLYVPRYYFFFYSRKCKASCSLHNDHTWFLRSIKLHFAYMRKKRNISYVCAWTSWCTRPTIYKRWCSNDPISSAIHDEEKKVSRRVQLQNNRTTRWQKKKNVFIWRSRMNEKSRYAKKKVTFVDYVIRLDECIYETDVTSKPLRAH